jgi:hypothetical protein
MGLLPGPYHPGKVGEEAALKISVKQAGHHLLWMMARLESWLRAPSSAAVDFYKNSYGDGTHK